MFENRYLKAVLILLILPLLLTAQNTNSPYSRYGFGVQEYSTLGKTRGMGGVSVGIREKNMINPSNPASYSALDTMTMLFDFGMTGSLSTFREASVGQTNPNGGLDYVAMKIPLKSWWGLAVGINQFSKVGYSYSFENTLSNDEEYVESYYGTGGLTSLFIGTSVALWKNLGLGVNYKYYSGMITQTSATSFTDADYLSQTVTEYWYLNGSSFDVGLQYQQPIGKRNKLILGATFSEKMPLNNTLYTVSIASDTITTTSESVFEMPRTIGLGASWIYDDRLTLALDYQQQNWADVNFHGVTDSLSNNRRISFGAEYLPSFITNSYYKAVKYRFGGYYSDSYISNDLGNLKTVGLTFGVGLPLRKQRSALNLSFEVGKVLPPQSSMVQETYYKLSLDITFNEAWFFKRKL